MKKSLLFSVCVAATMLLATSCQDEKVLGVNPGEEAVVSFNIGTPQIATRAFSDGTTATQLQYAVYDEQGNILPDLTVTDATINIRQTVNLKLTTGNKYTVVFWAAEPNAPYAVDFTAKTMTVDYDAAKTIANDEKRDAFLNDTTFTVSGNMAMDVHLRRPFAQLNIGTSDYAASVSAGYEVTKTSVKIPAYQTLNIIDGEVSTPVTVTYDWAAIPSGEDFPVEPAKNKYLSMNYILVDADKETVDVDFFYSNGSNDKTRRFGSVPVQRNYRTNIYGQLLTSDVDVNVEIIPDYVQPNNDVVVNADGSVIVTVANNEDLQDAINKATGNTTVRFADDITAVTRATTGVEIIVPQKEGVNLTIDGAGYKFDGTFYIHGAARYDKPETLTFTGINFEHKDGAIDFISCNTTVSAERYAHNVTVKDCTFTGDNNDGVVGMRYRQCFNLVVENVTATGMHSIMQATGCSGISFDRVTVENGNRGASLGTSTSIELKNSNIDVNTYGFRADGITTTFNVENTTINATQPIIVRKLTSDKEYTLNLTDVELTTTEPYHVVFTNGADDAEYVAPQGTFVITGAEKFNVFPTSTTAATAEEVKEALANGEDVVLTQDLAISATESNSYGATGINVLNGQTIDGGGNDFSADAWGTWGSAINTTGGIIRNINIVGAFRGIFINHNSSHAEKVILENVKIEGPTYTISCDQGTNNGLDAFNSTFNGWTSYAATIGDVYFENCNFGMGAGYAFCRPYAPTTFVNCEFQAGYAMDCRAACVFENCTLDGVLLTQDNISDLVGNTTNATVR